MNGIIMRWGAILVMAVPLAGQAPKVSSAVIETRAASELLQLLSSQSGAAWIGYDVPSVRSRELHCDFAERVRAPGPVYLEPPDRVRVLLRVEQNKVVKIRSISPDCELDAGGLRFFWVTGVSAEESIALLGGLSEHREAALTAIAQHAGSAADQALERFAAAGQPERLREKALFWMGAARGRRGYESLKRVIRGEPSERIREKAVFALSVSKEPGRLDDILSVARNDGSVRVRGQALFWLAQKAGKKAVEGITAALEEDPDLEVKKKAVFALHQIPNGEGIPMLIQVARTNKNPAVRKQAMFWLGQSKDPRALEFFEEVLTR